jgi:hypothetical protein
LTAGDKTDRYTVLRFKNFLPDLEILKPPEEPDASVGLFFLGEPGRPRRRVEKHQANRYTAAESFACR